jgi:hypothetical protein
VGERQHEGEEPQAIKAPLQHGGRGEKR